MAGKRRQEHSRIQTLRYTIFTQAMSELGYVDPSKLEIVPTRDFDSAPSSEQGEDQDHTATFRSDHTDDSGATFETSALASNATMLGSGSIDLDMRNQQAAPSSYDNEVTKIEAPGLKPRPCERCANMKIKCDKASPKCNRCASEGIACFAQESGLGKRPRTPKKLSCARCFKNRHACEGPPDCPACRTGPGGPHECIKRVRKRPRPCARCKTRKKSCKPSGDYSDRCANCVAGDIAECLYDY